MAKISVRFDLNIPKLKYRELKRPMVLVVDMVNGFVSSGAMADQSIKEIVPDIIELLRVVHPSIFFCDNHDLDAKEFESFPLHCIKNTQEAQIIDELKPFAKAVFKKNSTNAFVNEEINHYLKSIINDYQDFIIVGCCSDICVMQLALSLNTYFNEQNLNDQNVIVPVNMIETYHAAGYHDQVDYNEIALKLMQQSGIYIAEIGE